MSRYLEMKKRAMVMAANYWWQPSGLQAEDCLAAYVFVGADDETTALRDITEHGYDLFPYAHNGTTARSPYAKWYKEKGFTAEGGQSQLAHVSDHDRTKVERYENIAIGTGTSLACQDIRSIVVRFTSDWATSSMEGWSPQRIASPRGSNGNALIDLWIGGTWFPVIPYTASRGGRQGGRVGQNISGVVGASWGAPRSTDISYVRQNNFSYFNGVNYPIAEETVFMNDLWEQSQSGNQDGKFWTNPNLWNHSSDYHFLDVLKLTYPWNYCVQAAAFFKVPLTDDQQKEIADNVMNL